MRIVPADSGGIAQAVETLRAGEVVAYPTETVYGLAVDPFSEAAVRRLFAVKGRPESNPVLLVVADVQQLERIVREIPAHARAYMEAFWPGPLSLVFPRADNIPGAITGGGENVCARQSAHPTAQALCIAFGGPITSSSANRSGMPPVRALAEIDFPGVAMGIDGGTLPVCAPSTVFDPITHRVLREGAIAAARLEKIADLGNADLSKS